jgi:hypothetical protein
MLVWDDVGETGIGFADADAGHDAIGRVLGSHCVPLVVHDHARAGILGAATLIERDGRPMLLTASHLFDEGWRDEHWLAPSLAGGELLSLRGARVLRSEHADLALLELDRVAALPALLRGRRAVPMRSILLDRRRAVPGRTYAICGFPSAWSRFDRGWLAAKRVVIVTGRCVPLARQSVPQGNLYAYGRVARRHDGTSIHTPALDGMSGAGIWELQRSRNHGMVARLAAVQSSFLHSGYVRGAGADAMLPLLSAI